MPVTAKLSKAFYEKMGEQVTNELVEWFNSVDSTYRADLRELNELNFARFDAKVEQRFAESEARNERRLAAIESRFPQLEESLKAYIERRIGEQSRANFAMWLTTMLAFLGLYLRR